MPNLKQLYALKNEYGKINESERKVLEYLKANETKDVLQKAFDSRRLDERETRLFSFLNENLNPNKPEMIKYFDDGIEQDVALLFIDITSFSKTIQGWSNSQTTKFLDEYYKKIIPIIYNNRGEIEKLMGDGIICVFGKPFLDKDKPDCVYPAEECAQQVIKAFHNTNKNVKVAIHTGKVNYYKVPGEQYGEYTMIGQPITELYRLESVSKPNAINFYTSSAYDRLGWTYSIFDNTIVNCRGFKITELQGVDFTEVKYMIFPGYN